MRKLAYIYDHRYYVSDGVVYSSGALTVSTWDRFLPVFDELTVFGTLKTADESKVRNLNQVSREKVAFVSLDYVDTPQKLLRNIFLPDPKLAPLIDDFDAVVVRVPGNLSTNAFWLARKRGIPVGIEVVGCPWDSYWNYGNLAGKLLAPLMWFQLRRITYAAGYSIYVTENFLQTRYPTRGKWINASNVDLELPAESILQSKKKLLCDLTEFRIGLMGSFDVRYKGHTELLKALAKIKPVLPPFRVELVGPGDSAWIVALAKELGLISHLSIIGKIPSGDPVMEWLDGLHLYVHPSKQEGLPRSVIEAMSRACPVLASSVAGIPELLQPEFMHRPGDYAQLAIQLEKVIDNRDNLYSVGADNYQKAKEYDRNVLEKRRADFWTSFAVSEIHSID